MYFDERDRVGTSFAGRCDDLSAMKVDDNPRKTNTMNNQYKNGRVAQDRDPVITMIGGKVAVGSISRVGNPGTVGGHDARFHQSAAGNTEGSGISLDTCYHAEDGWNTVRWMESGMNDGTKDVCTGKAVPVQRPESEIRADEMRLGILLQNTNRNAGENAEMNDIENRLHEDRVGVFHKPGV